MRGKKVEVLAPAGSFESLKAAVAAGADAVYLGGTRFGARAYAKNLSKEQMLEAIDYAHLHGVSLYLTVNTLVKETELKELYGYLLPYYRQGLDAVIVQDLGVFSYIRSCFPKLPIHVSTQMTITGVYGAGLLRRLGAVRVVPARELSLSEIRRIHEEVEVELECFVHGALCYCYSGQCLLSSLIGGRSGNRGRCAQPCRLPYEVLGAGRKNPKEQYMMNLKDLCVLDILPKLLEAGIDSLKIEGRMKSPRYTAGVVSIYRRYVDQYLKYGRTGYQVDPEDKKCLLELFDRGGLTEGYYFQQNGKNMMALYGKPSFRQENQKLSDYLDSTYVNKEIKEPVSGGLLVEEAKPVTLKLWRDRDMTSVCLAGPIVQTARNQPLTEEELKKQIQKTGDTPFVFSHLETKVEGRVFLPVQTLKELRRTGLQELRQAVLRTFKREDVPDELPLAERAAKPGRALSRGHAAAGAAPFSLHVLLSDLSCLPVVLRQKEVTEIQVEGDGCEAERWKEVAAACHEAGKRCVLAMPVIFRTQAEQYFDARLDKLAEAGFDGLLVRSLEEAEYGDRRGLRLPFYGDHNLYCFNHMASSLLELLGMTRLTLPLELNGKELEELSSGEPDNLEYELIVYGYIPVMVSAQCIRKTMSGCTRHPGRLKLKDRTGRELMVRNHCAFCYNTILNPEPLSLLGQEKQVARICPASLRLQFTVETKEQAEQVLGAYVESFLQGGEGRLPAGAFTRGHFKRGVE